MTDQQIEALAHRTAWRYKKSSDPAHSDTYTFNRVTLLRFADDLVRGLETQKTNCTHPNCNCWMGVCGKGKAGGHT